MNTMMFVRTACICLMVLAAVSGVDSAAPASSQLQAAAPHARAPARRLLAASFPPSDWRSLQFNIQTGQLFDMSVHRLPGVSTYIIDGMATPPATVAAMVQAGLQPLCYLRVGTAQDWASDYASFAAGDQGSALASDAQQFWVDVRSASVRTIMSARITACASAGYSAVVADFISDYGQTPGNSLGLTTSDYAAYLTWLSDTVTAAGMGFGAMDGPDVLNVPGVLDKLGFAVATGCASKSTCPMFAAIPAAGKPVFVWEEATDWPAGTNAFMVNVCAQHAALGLITILKGSSTSTRDLQSLPWVGCPPPFWAPVASQPPAFPPINWQTRVPPLALNLQPRQTFDLDAQRLTNVSAYVLSPWTNSAAAVYNMSAAGLFAICYASVGTAHNASSDWAAFQSVHLGNALPNGRERWVDVRADAVRASMFSRLALCASKGFTAVLLDNIYSTPATNGLGLSTADYTDYLTWVIDVVHGLGLTVGALDGGELLQGMSPLPGLDFGVTQECVRYSTCDQVKTVYANKPWFNVEFEEYHQNYSSFVTSVCSKEASGGFIASLKSRSLRSMPWASCSMAPSALQSGSTAVQPLVKVVNGELCMQGLPVMVNGTLRAPKEVSCSAGPKYLSILNGTLGLPDVEDELVLGPAMFAVHRSVDWLYDATLQSFTASVNVSGHLKMVLWDDFTQALATVSPVAVNLTGRLTFTSKDYPGPGFSGLYTWAGSLTITPDPYQALGLGPLAVSRRRHLLAAAAGDTHIDAGRQLLQASGEAAVDVTVQGSITAAEASTISPSTDADTARGDTNAWVEPSGAVKILERDTIPEALIPFWKKPAPGPPGLSATARLLIYVFAAITALMLGTLLGLAVYLHRLRKRQAARMAELQDVYGPGDDGASPQGYGSPDSPGYGPRGDYRPPSSTGPSPGPYAGEYDEQEGYARPQYRSSQEGAWDGRVRQASLLAEQEGQGAGGARRAYGQ